MGNRGMTNWKLGAFFVIALTLMTGLFGSTALAGDGDGTISVSLKPADPDVTTFTESALGTAGVDIGIPNIEFVAGSEKNALRLTYTAAVNDETTEDVDESEGADMRGGLIQILFPTHEGWGISDKFITITERESADASESDVVIYQTDKDGEVLDGGGARATVGTATDRARVIKSGSRITVRFDAEWNEPGRQLIIELGDVTAPNYRGKSEFTTRTRGTPNGRLTDLGSQPIAYVGNIAIAKAGAFTILPEAVYENQQDVVFRIAFTAAGPLHDVYNTADTPLRRTDTAVRITIPQINPEGGTAGDIFTSEPSTTNVTVSRKIGTVVLGGLDDDDDEAEVTVSGDVIQINIKSINAGDTVELIYNAGSVDDLQAADTTVSNDNRFLTEANDGLSWVSLEASKDKTGYITTGEVRPRAGSGTIETNNEVVEAASRNQDFTLTYKAAVPLTDDVTENDVTTPDVDEGALLPPTVDLTITVPAVITTQVGTTSGENGYIEHDAVDDPTIEGRTITWMGLEFPKAGETFEITINNVTIDDAPGKSSWGATIADTEISPAASLFVVDTAKNGVELDIIAANFNPISVPEYNAAGEEDITFRFTATKTPIRNGNVVLTLPGWGTLTEETDTTKHQVGATPGNGTSLHATADDQVVIGTQKVTVSIEEMPIGGTVDVTYKMAVVPAKADDEVEIRGTFTTSGNASSRSVESVTLKIINVADGTGTATIETSAGDDLVQAGSNNNVIEVRFTAAGTMDGGKVELQIPRSWGRPQTDRTKSNYLGIDGPASLALKSSYVAVATIDKLEKGRAIMFVYGGGTGGSKRGAQAQDDLGIADFTIRSDGEGDGIFALIAGEEQSDDDKEVNSKALGRVYDSAPGILKLNVVGASDGSGHASLTVKSSSGVVRAADEDVKIEFVYTPTETIQNGALEFITPSGWSDPQSSNQGDPGFTSVTASVGGAIGTEESSDDTLSVDIYSIDKEDTITIVYESAKANSAAVPGLFTIQIKGGDTDDNNFRAIRGTKDSESLEVTVEPQASGKGNAVITVTPDDGSTKLYAGQKGREFTIVYTAVGQMIAGGVRLTIPPMWSAPTMGGVDVMVSSSGSHGDIIYGAGETPPTQIVTVDGVGLNAGGTVTFVYTGDVQPTQKDAVAFKVEVDGGLEADEFKAVEGDETMLTVDVGSAKQGSGMGEVDKRVVETGATGVTLRFTYTAEGQIPSPSEFQVIVDPDWSPPTDKVTGPSNKGTYQIEHRRDGARVRRIVEELDPIDGERMAARVQAAHVRVGDEVIFIYQNADAPTEDETSTFQILFENEVVENIEVYVQSTSATQLVLNSAGTVSADPGAAPLAVTVSLQDDDENDRVTVNAVKVTLRSSSATGAFSLTADGAGTASLVVDIAAGMSSAMAYYSDSAGGTTATITATAPGSGLTAATPPPVTVITGIVEITAGSVTVSPTIAKDGDTVTVTAMATAGQAPLVTIGALVAGGAMIESPSGTYTRSAPLAAGTQEGTYGVTVSLGGEMETAVDMLTVDNTDPVVTVTAPESAEDGETVMISAMVTDAGTVSSVTADVSALDSTQTMLTLAMAADGSYSAPLEISEKNAALNGAKTITVTAMDAAGNSGMGTATVELANKLSFTSMIPAGTVLFHVPLDDDDVSTVGDLKTKLGAAVNLAIIWNTAEGRWDSNSDDVMVDGDLGIVLVMSAEASVTFTGDAWDGGTSMISLQSGTNVIGLPVNDPRVENVSDIAELFASGVVASVLVSADNDFKSVDGEDDTDDGPVMGDAGYLVTASRADTAALIGSGWSNGDDAASAAPIALVGYNVDSQTAVLDVNGAIVDEITGLTREGFRVKVKNLSTKASLSKVTSAETAEGYNMTFVDLKAGHAARIGDVLEISADSPNPLIGVQPVRHIVTVDDVKNSTIQLEELIAYEIPAETELLRNYPNPFNPETWIPYRLAEDADVSLTIYDVSGETVRTIDIGHQTAAMYETRAKAIYWDGRNRFGEQIASGIYFYSLSAGDFSATRKMVILK